METVQLSEIELPNHRTKFTRKPSTKWKKLFIVLGVIVCFALGYVICRWYFLTKTAAADEHDPSEMARRRDFIRNMTRSAWRAYMDSAWTADALDPINSTGITLDYGPDSGWTIVASMSTLWLMNLNEEFKIGREWIASRFNLSQIDRTIPIEMIENDFLSSFLSCYALTQDKMFLERANEIVRLLEPAYQNFEANKPMSLAINPSTGKVSNLDEYLKIDDKIGKFLPESTAEYSYLVQLTNKDDDDGKLYRQRFNTLTQQLQLYLEQNRNNSKPKHRQYNAFLKWYVQSHGNAAIALETYEEGIDSQLESFIVRMQHEPLTYVKSYDYKKLKYVHQMKYSDCYLGSMLALGSKEMRMALLYHNTTDWTGRIDRFKHHKQIARELTDTCHQAMYRTVTGLSPSVFYFDDDDEATNSKNLNSHEKQFNLNPELAQSYFVLWRQTHDVKYRDFAWEMAQSIETHCQTKFGGYGSVANVDQIPTKILPQQQPDLLSGTLKYLYLTFCNYTIWPLDRWVYSTTGHPIPINIENK
ncbi:hypothetical protein BLOT_002540 [Blomia tropicalis]|nr:hypothetical protein BLOT_002540 [Blomia tropicalis]